MGDNETSFEFADPWTQNDPWTNAARALPATPLPGAQSNDKGEPPAQPLLAASVDETSLMRTEIKFNSEGMIVVTTDPGPEWASMLHDELEHSNIGCAFDMSYDLLADIIFQLAHFSQTCRFDTTHCCITDFEGKR